MNDREHDRHLDQHADHRRERRARLEAEERDGRRDGELEEIAGADQRRRAGDAPLDADGAIEQIGEARVEIDLDQDRNGQQADDKRLADDLLALQAEEKWSSPTSCAIGVSLAVARSAALE